LKRSRVVFLIENMSFPRDPRVRREATALQQDGWDVSVIAPGGADHDTRWFEVMGGVKVYRYWQPWQGTGIPGYLLEYGWAMTWTFVLICWIWITDGFEVLHAANPPDLFCVVAFPFILFGKQFVFDQHDLCPELLEARLRRAGPLRKLLFLFERWSYKLANLAIVTNRSAYDIALVRGATAERLCIVRNGPDLASLADAEFRPALREGADYLALYVGQISPQDGVDRVVRAAFHVVHICNRSDIRFAILGEGDSVRELQELARALGVERYVSFCGWVEGADFNNYLATADVCLSPEPPEDFNQRSSFIKLTDYMSCGKVTVCFDLLESRRTLGPAGIFVEHDDPAHFGDAILRILDDPDSRRKLGRIAGVRLRRSFHWGLSRTVLLHAYETVVRNGASLCCDDVGMAVQSTDEGE
jgi:glycosyltransferase involved in cell wall biosynthesis